ncbi:MAG: glycosyltransferase family 4 protein [Candidatus Korarchaeota archaeon]|nr:glycosyltransferase family 4 protein [Candidatus Korarchaeota archaeon]NIU85285.1 glycosyltransferase [Candidatus Thorarchaeota archaeon]NIW15383.1 glycosyltransferase [Candidatus Thorarchaeota archaeon]
MKNEVNIMHVLFLTDTYYPFVSGVARVIESLSTALNKQGIRTTIVCPSPSLTVTSYVSGTSQSNQLYNLPSARLLKVYDSFRFPVKPPVVLELVKEDDTVISVHSPFFSTAGAVMTAMKVKERRNIEIPIVSTFHTNIDLFSQKLVPSYFPRSPTHFLIYLMKKLLNRTLFTTVPSSSVEESLHNKGIERILTVPHPLTYEIFHSPTISLSSVYPFLDSGKYFLTLGRVSREKRVEYLIKAFLNLDIPLVIGGTGPHLPNLKQKYEQEPNIYFLGFVPEGHLKTLYRNAVAILSASYAETLGLSLLEGMAQKTPAIAYRKGGQTSYIEHGTNGFLYSTIKELRNKVRTLFNNPDLQKEMGNNARTTALHYHPDNLIHEWKTVFTTALRLAKKHELY